MVPPERGIRIVRDGCFGGVRLITFVALADCSIPLVRVDTGHELLIVQLHCFEPLCHPRISVFGTSLTENFGSYFRLSCLVPRTVFVDQLPLITMYGCVGMSTCGGQIDTRCIGLASNTLAHKPVTVRLRQIVPLSGGAFPRHRLPDFRESVRGFGSDRVDRRSSLGLLNDLNPPSRLGRRARREPVLERRLEEQRLFRRVRRPQLERVVVGRRAMHREDGVQRQEQPQLPQSRDQGLAAGRDDVLDPAGI